MNFEKQQEDNSGEIERGPTPPTSPEDFEEIINLEVIYRAQLQELKGELEELESRTDSNAERISKLRENIEFLEEEIRLAEELRLE